MGLEEALVSRGGQRILHVAIRRWTNHRLITECDSGSALISLREADSASRGAEHYAPTVDLHTPNVLVMMLVMFGWMMHGRVMFGCMGIGNDWTPVFVDLVMLVPVVAPFSMPVNRWSNRHGSNHGWRGHRRAGTHPYAGVLMQELHNERWSILGIHSTNPEVQIDWPWCPA